MIKSHKNNRNRWLYKCRCICGKYRYLLKYQILLLQKQTKCRCNDNNAEKDICVHQLFLRYKIDSQKKNKKFLLSKETFEVLILKNCFYCNKPPSQKINVTNKYKLKYNGIDRLKNNKGYINNNVVTCCWFCNQAKKNLDFVEFKNWINTVSNNLNKGE